MRAACVVFFVGSALCTAICIARAEIVELRLDAPTSFVDNAQFGAAGTYMRLKGTARGELDPKDKRNTVIVGLDKAPLNARGRVEYESDVYILQPADPAKRSGTLLYEVTNRGQKFLFTWVQDSSAKQDVANDARAIADVGAMPLLLQRGDTIVWSGWEPDAPKDGGGMAIRVPIATDRGKPIVMPIREEFQIGTRSPPNLDLAKLSYPAAETDMSKARLTMRDHETDPRQEIGGDKWGFVDARTIRLLPEGTKFVPRRIYELWYDAKDPKVTGIGYAATRDLVSFLRYATSDRSGNANPLASERKGIKYAIGFGIAQSGRYLRHHLELGMNEDERGQGVFDGIFTHISGVGKVFNNELFAEPARTATQHEDRFYPEAWFPFSYASSKDALSAASGGLLHQAKRDPKVIETNTSTEYWQSGASLTHTDPAGTRDLAEEKNVRHYLITGTQHSGRFGSDDKRGPCANPRNPHSASPALRALLVDLEEWVTHGTAPPKSRVPRIADGGLVPFAALRWPDVPGLLKPPGDNKLGRPVDWVNPPVHMTKTYASLLPAIDADGNETSGLRLPDQAVPAATFTGWNVYQGLESELCDRDGSYAPFGPTRAEREKTNDPRQSLEERYGLRDYYVATVRSVADKLVKERLLLATDADAYVKAARGAKF